MNDYNWVVMTVLRIIIGATTGAAAMISLLSLLPPFITTNGLDGLRKGFVDGSFAFVEAFELQLFVLVVLLVTAVLVLVFSTELLPESLLFTDNKLVNGLFMLIEQDSSDVVEGSESGCVGDVLPVTRCSTFPAPLQE